MPPRVATNAPTPANVLAQHSAQPPQTITLAANKRRSFSGHGGGLLNRMFGSSGKEDGSSGTSTDSNDATTPTTPTSANSSSASNTEAVSDRNSMERQSIDANVTPTEKKRRSSSVAKAKDIFASAKQAFNPHNPTSPTHATNQTPLQKLSRADPALGVPQGSHNNSAGESMPGPRSTFRVGVTEDKNKKCRRTMEDTHAYLYNFLSTPQPTAVGTELDTKAEIHSVDVVAEKGVAETDNGYFAIFDGHAGTFAADWCGKKLHHILEDIIRKNPSTPIPELLDQTFTSVDQQLDKLPLKNSGCTAVTAVLRWEDRVPNAASATGSTYLNQATAKASHSDNASKDGSEASTEINSTAPAETKLIQSATRQRVLYTANVGDARIVLCRNGRALRLSYDHKGSDEQEGRRVANAGGLILNNRVNGVLAVTRALGDTYMKDLVTGHPYTTETVIQPDTDEFLILACDGLWDVCSDQESVDLIRGTHDPQLASKQLVDHALARFSTDNLSCMVIRFNNKAIKEQRLAHNIGVEGDPETLRGTISEADAIVSSVKKLQDEGMVVEPTPNAVDEAKMDAIKEEQQKVRGKGEPEIKPEAAEEAKKANQENVERTWG